MELRHLRYFVAVAEEMSFTRAAARLHMAQPALSVQIRQLEDELGVPLFDRSRRTIALTEGGTVMLAEARRLLGLLDNAVELVRRTGRGAVGRIAIGFVPSASNAALPPLPINLIHACHVLLIREVDVQPNNIPKIHARTLQHSLDIA